VALCELHRYIHFMANACRWATVKLSPTVVVFRCDGAAGFQGFAAFRSTGSALRSADGNGIPNKFATVGAMLRISIIPKLSP
jgi:hypothetical protein